MSGIETLLQNIDGLTPLTVALVLLAGLVVGIAPSSFPLIAVATGLGAGLPSGVSPAGCSQTDKLADRVISYRNLASHVSLARDRELEVCKRLAAHSFLWILRKSVKSSW